MSGKFYVDHYCMGAPGIWVSLQRMRKKANGDSRPNGVTPNRKQHKYKCPPRGMEERTGEDLNNGILFSTVQKQLQESCRNLEESRSH
ncbi:hypothetical protein STEG23_006296 [Scotinomys teguina]